MSDKTLVPIKTWMQEKVRQGYFTPDSVDIALHTHHIVFVYGTLRLNHIRNDILTMDESNKLLNYGFTDLDNLQMAYSFKSRFPAVFFHEKDSEGNARIFGEIWSVTEETLRYLDRVEGNGVAFKRMPMTIKVFEKDSTISTVKHVWMYLGMPGYLQNNNNWYRLKPHQSSMFGPYYTYLNKIELAKSPGTHVVP